LSLQTAPAAAHISGGMFGSLLQPEIREMIAEKNFGALRGVFADWPEADLAELIADLPENEQVVVFRLLPHQAAADTFEYLDVEVQQNLLRAMGKEETARVINGMSPDDRTALLEELPSAAVAQLVRLLSPEERAIAQALLNYPENSVGRLMTPDFISVPEHWTVGQVFDFIRKNGQDSETLNVLYVVDEKGRLIDDVRIREFLLKPLDCRVAEIHDQAFVALKVTDDQEVAVEMFKKYDRNTLPVVDSSGVLVGIVTVDDVIDVIEEEATEDIQKLGGVEALDEPYSTISMWRLVQKRGGWLAALFLGELLTASAMTHFQGEIEKAAVVALFLPLIISSGGNSGSQASTLIIRAMALGEIELKDWWRVMRRELTCGLILGLFLGLIGVFRIHVWQMIGFVNYNTNAAFVEGGQRATYNIPGLYHQIALTVGVALVGVVLWGTLCGAMLPFLLRKLKLDPATISAPLVATLVDVTGLVIYFSVASLVLRGTLL
jgi:magnesium transporter